MASSESGSARTLASEAASRPPWWPSTATRMLAQFTRGHCRARRVTPASSPTVRAVSEEKAWPNGAPQVGERAERTRRVEAADIERFTDMTGDRNPLHYDEEAAARSRFGGIIVQGGITSGILNAVVAEDLPGPGTVFLHVEWDFKAPVSPGDEITGAVQVLDVRADKPITRLRTTVTRGDGVVALDGTALCYTTPI